MYRKPFGRLGLNNSSGITRGLVGAWALNEGNSVEQAKDLSGNRNHGDKTACEVGRGLNGPGALFNATTSLINCGSGASLDDMSAITVVAWIYPLSTGESGVGKIVSKRGDVAALAGWHFGMGTGPNLNIGIDHATTDMQASSATNLTLNQWSQVAWRWDGGTTASSSIVFFINGTSTGLAASPTNGAGARVSDAANPLIIGNLGPAAERTFDGLIDHVLVFNRLLIAAEINLLYRDPYMWLRPEKAFRYAAIAAGGFQPAWAANSNVLLGGSMVL